ncbi:bifunctional [glutamate--ammonia ligase]-adenylyl-L-tyrosine phosphorylase/[glutamate--ammonia-ligase] adenylyltransferase [Sediminicurvatus halobius]|uniref:Bifunctional glutamine synthetase adenylyltransferase/adenylyl-removing enzyme n=1 Tax=Sediminicurvatus halobius TaxID=2182432 RepID=A0A2U2N752_9GAMM|nr:bifunctional [glutamate--ammonia ligase]-adenylyl-L-tyrosine phosphorylase/[glutamate--ammonia-ligase] adenylyltransferase [Spiribacter halobius]PWG64907.1 bifunctional [glutamate--ammonia ligase]-adenylyl-L-tyrosine phosphorylase/[glutamate--ammonia-ligase] adenylyltransferase [Spiribacter halobius]UEX78236.1 bifunctional [glutamate--ammonia ligase]-adenylyl-L-tyrosine phosphorylase/[glutamate--ammonia-ligase] adenylyltransferase [Spiribacter halobius]
MDIDTLPKPVAQALAALPENLQAPVRTALERLPDDPGLPPDDAVAAELPRVWAMSEFVSRVCLRSPGLLPELVASSDLAADYGEQGHRDRLRARLADVADEAGLHRTLRRFREREMLRIAWRDLTGRAGLEEVLRDLSRLADCCLDEALEHLYAALCERWGTPRNADGEAQRLVVLGMGKLGGEELNFSSDIDLIFAYPDVGETDGERPRTNEEFFARLGRQLIAALDQQTADGQVFRVDMRLRPYGDSGPLAMSFPAMELYYQEQGREWERYALVKARVVAGDQAQGAELLKTLTPFVYRRYLDYGALESLREMKGMIAREVKRRGLADNIKLGRGGIREVEFIGQAFQLIRGGQAPELRERRLLPVLDYLAEHGQLPPRARDELAAAYRFLRRTENRIQAMHDRQGHDLPAAEPDRTRLVLAMGARDWSSFRAELDGWRRKVQGHFDQVFVAPQQEDDAESTDAPDLPDVWQGLLDEETADEVLAAEGFAEPARVRQRLLQFRDGHSVRALSAQGRTRLDRLMPMLLAAAAGADHPDATIERLLALLEGIVRRTAYLSLLNEHPMALSQLVRLAGGSPWIARFLALHPMLLDELLDPRTLYAPLGRQALERDLAERLEAVGADDLERQMEVLRHFKQSHVLRVAAADLGEAIPVMLVSDYLTDIAEVVLEAVLRLAWHHVRSRYGEPHREDGDPAGFAIVAYGKLGSFELGYGSDLDLVFLHDPVPAGAATDGDKPVEPAVFFARLAQRIIHMLSTPTPGGVLYEVDTRLRPSGKSGLLTTSLEAFADYQRRQAWTWEHQALVRARVVAGLERLAEGFREVRREILTQPRDRDELRESVRQMRERMRREKAARKPGLFDLKQERGGIADIEFVVQYGVLAGASDYPGLLRYTDNIRLLDELERGGVLAAEHTRVLADAYRAYRGRLHRLTLQEAPALVPEDEIAEARAAVTDVWERVMGGEAAGEPATDSKESRA